MAREITLSDFACSVADYLSDWADTIYTLEAGGAGVRVTIHSSSRGSFTVAWPKQEIAMNVHRSNYFKTLESFRELVRVRINALAEAMKD